MAVGEFHAIPFSMTVQTEPQVLIPMSQWETMKQDGLLNIVLMAMYGAARRLVPEDLPAALYTHYFPHSETPFIDFEARVTQFAQKAQAEREEDERRQAAAKAAMPA